MNRRALPVLAALLALAACSTPDVPTAPPALSRLPVDAIMQDPTVHVHLARGVARYAKPGGGSSQLLWHNGAILTSTSVKAVFWGTSWGNSAFTSDKESGLDSFYGGVGGTAYMKTNVEYTGTNGTVGSGVSYGGHVVDLSAGPRRAPSTSTIQAEVCKMISAPVANGYYPVYTDLPRGHASYCAWHSYGTCNGVPVQFGFFFALDGDGGCDPGDTSGQHSQGLSALANVSGHELSETVTDPRNGGWYDASGAENADKCAWTFSGYSNFGGSNWLIQGNWSNAAYTANSGYTRGGCIVR